MDCQVNDRAEFDWRALLPTERRGDELTSTLTKRQCARTLGRKYCIALTARLP